VLCNLLKGVVGSASPHLATSHARGGEGCGCKRRGGRASKEEREGDLCAHQQGDGRARKMQRAGRWRHDLGKGRVVGAFGWWWCENDCVRAPGPSSRLPPSSAATKGAPLCPSTATVHACPGAFTQLCIGAAVWHSVQCKHIRCV